MNDGWFGLQIQLFTDSGQYLAEPSWLDTSLNPSQGLTPQTVDVPEFALDQGFWAASLYRVRFRVMPWDFSGSNPGLAFTQMAVVPEPTTSAAVVAAGLVAFGVVRRLRSNRR